MPKESDMGIIEKSSGNVYEDLGLPNAGEMQVKATLAAKIGDIIKHRHLTQVEASEILGIAQPKLPIPIGSPSVQHSTCRSETGTSDIKNGMEI